MNPCGKADSENTTKKRGEIEDEHIIGLRFTTRINHEVHSEEEEKEEKESRVSSIYRLENDPERTEKEESKTQKRIVKQSSHHQIHPLAGTCFLSLPSRHFCCLLVATFVTTVGSSVEIV